VCAFFDIERALMSNPYISSLDALMNTASPSPARSSFSSRVPLSSPPIPSPMDPRSTPRPPALEVLGISPSVTAQTAEMILRAAEERHCELLGCLEETREKERQITTAYAEAVEDFAFTLEDVAPLFLILLSFFYARRFALTL